MKIKDKYPNYSNGLMYFIGDKNPILGSNDSKLFAYYIPLANTKKGFDFYELKCHPSGAVYFSIATMLGLRTIITTTSELYTEDLTEMQWGKIVGDITNKHFFREEYQALKRGYIQKKSGCMGSILFTIVFIVLIGFSI